MYSSIAATEIVLLHWTLSTQIDQFSFQNINPGELTILFLYDLSHSRYPKKPTS